MEEQNRQISEAIERDGERLRGFVRSRVPDAADVEEVLQDVFFELVAAYRLMRHPEQVPAWLYRVARNRIVDLFRRRSREARAREPLAGDGESMSWEELLPSPDAGPEAALARRRTLDALHAALGELPREQREAFVAHEIDGESFRAMAERTGVGINTLLARKRYAVLHLRRRLRTVYDDFPKE